MQLLQAGLISLSFLPLISTLLLGYQLLRNGQGAWGKPTINKWVFFATKLAITLLLAGPAVASVFPNFFSYLPILIQSEIPDVQKLLALIFLLAGNLLLIPAYYTMSIFTRVGLPTRQHALQTSGVYKISRNPMYASFIFFNTACFLLIPCLPIAALIIFSLLAHHIIILREEQFLTSTFQQDYLDYKNQTARYL